MTSIPLSLFTLFRRFSTAGAAPAHQFVPAFGFHKLGPAAVEIAQIVLARFWLGEVADHSGNPESLPFVIFDLGPHPLLVIVRITARNRAAAGGMCVIPVLHVVL